LSRVAQRADYPQFKKKGIGDSFRYPDAKQFKIDAGNSRVNLPKMSWIRYCNSQDILGTASTSPYQAGAADGSCRSRHSVRRQNRYILQRPALASTWA
jgi:hypothetical protein